MKHLVFLVVKKLSNMLAGSGIGKNPLIAKLYHFTLPKIKPEITKVGEHYMYLDKNDSLALSLFGGYERLETQIYQSEIKQGMTVFDIGAFIGDSTLIFAQLVGPNGTVHAFEPDSENFITLKKNIQLNKYDNVIAIPKAVADTTEKRIFYLSPANMADHSLYKLNSDRKYVEVETITIDDYCVTAKCKIDFLKMDIQGAEGEAWLGMRKTIRNNPNIIILTEYYPAGLDKSKVNHEQYIDNIVSEGFKIYYIDDKNQNIQLKSKQEILELTPQIPYCNLLLKR